MTISSQGVREEYDCDGEISVFDFPHPVLEAAHIRVTILNGGEAEPFPGEYEISLFADDKGFASAARVTFGRPVAAAARVRLERIVPIVQEARFANQGGFYPETVEKALDKLTMIDQQQGEQIARALVAPPGETGDAFAADMAAAMARIPALASAVAALADDPRMSDPRTPLPHAASHETGGTDQLTPAAVGALPAAPDDGKRYLVSGGGFVEYIPPSGGGGPGGGTSDHADLLNRDAANQHPVEAVAGLRPELDGLSAKLDAHADALDGHAAELESLRNDMPTNPAVPVGAILPFGGAAAPADWLLCDGAAVSREAYPELFGVVGTAFGAGDGETTFNVPDSRGEFLRGLDNGRGVDPGRAMGSAQADALQHMSGAFVQGAATHGGQLLNNILTGVFGHQTDVAYTTISGSVPVVSVAGSRGVTFDASRVARTAGETRPRNVAVNYIIKY